MKTIVPIPIDSELADLIESTAKETGLKKADVMRQGLRQGVPLVAESLRLKRRRPACLDYLDDYPKSSIPARDTKHALKELFAKKRHAQANR